MSKKAQRIALIVLALVMLTSLFTGCGKKESAPELKKVQYVYKASEFPALPQELKNVSQIMAANGSLYFFGNYYNEGWTESGYRLFRCKPDGTEMTRVDLGIEDRKEGEEKEEDIGTKDFYINSLNVVPDGSVWYLMQTTSFDDSDPENYIWEEHSLLRHVTPDGQTVAEIDMDKFKEDPEDYFYVSSLATDADGYLYMVAGGDILILKSDGSQHCRIQVDQDNGSVDTMVRTGNGKVIASFYTGAGSGLLREIDREAKGFGAEAQLGLNEDGKVRGSYVTIMPGYGCTVFYRDNQNVYAYDMASKTETTVLNFINSDLNSNETGNLVPISENQMLTTVYNWDSETGDENIMVELLTKVPDEEIQPKRIITLGTTGLNYDTRKRIVDFNKSSDIYRIEVRDYSDQNGIAVTYAGGAAGMGGGYEFDWEAGMKKFNTDIVSGNIPDIIQIDANMPYDSYVAKGLLADLYPYLEKDEELKKEDFLPNVLKALEKDGKLYSVIPSFSVLTIVGKASVVGDRASWTMDEMADMLKNLPAGSQLFTEMPREQFMNYAMTLSASSFVNYATGECHFDSPSFKRLLEIARTFPEEINWEELYGEDYDWSEYEMQYRSNKTLLQQLYLSDFASLHNIEAVQYGERISFIGFPSDSGTGSAISAGQRYAVYAKSKNGEGAWAFLRTFLTDEYQDQIYTFPVKLSSLEKLQQKAQEPYSYEDEDGNIVEMPNTYWMQDEEIDIGYPTQEECDRVMAFIGSVTTLYRTDSSLMEIINDEAGGFFAGQRSVDDVAGVIQNRVKTYLAENR